MSAEKRKVTVGGQAKAPVNPILPARRRRAQEKIEQSARDMIRRRRRFAIGMVVALVGLQIFSPATLVILMLGMVPTIVSYLADTDIQKRSAHCMAALNLAGVVPVLTWLWESGGNRAAAANLLSDPLNWLLMYGSAGLALLLVTGLPVIVSQVLVLHNAKQARLLEKELSYLADEWDGGVARESEPPASADGHLSAVGTQAPAGAHSG